jgi:hypothetical protein
MTKANKAIHGGGVGCRVERLGSDSCEVEGEGAASRLECDNGSHAAVIRGQWIMTSRECVCVRVCARAPPSDKGRADYYKGRASCSPSGSLDTKASIVFTCEWV